MKTLYIYKLLLLLALSFIFNGCTETYVLQSNDFEEVLVVEATITNELKKQEIKISKTTKLEEKGIKIEKGAQVTVKDDLGQTYSFNEQNGIYLSETEFQAIPDRVYTLEIKTKDGKIYQSSKENLTTINPMESVIPSVTTDQEKGRGVQIRVNSHDPNNTSKYYRYEYEETYKIIAPHWRAEKLIVTGPQQVEVVPNSTDTKTCYSTEKSDDVILMSTTDLKEDRVDFQIRFISDQNYIISHRYSILVKQYIQSLESYTFRKTMKEIASSESILSPKQPGFVIGNIKCISNTDEKTIGFFEVSSVSSKRIFFNYTDLFPNEPMPPFRVNCELEVYPFCFEPTPECKGYAIIQGTKGKTLSYFFDSGTLALPVYNMFFSWCGDCTTFSSNKIPSFWIN